MAAAGPRERIATLIRDVEKAARQLRSDIRKRAQAAPKSMEDAAKALRRGAADLAGQVEKYIHELRMGLEGRKPAAAHRTAARRKPAKRKPARRKPARRKARS